MPQFDFISFFTQVSTTTLFLAVFYVTYLNFLLRDLFICATVKNRLKALTAGSMSVSAPSAIKTTIFKKAL